MQIVSNTIQSVILFYKKELATVYSESELQNITRWVLEHQLEINSTEIILNPDARINESDLVRLEQMCFDLKKNKPIQYVLGEAEFYKLKFKINESVLIPRPETEELVELVVKNLKSKAQELQTSNFKLLDIGTGSGCISVSIKKNISSANVYAMDISDAALEIAKYNAAHNNVEVNFFKANVLQDAVSDIVLASTSGGKLDIIVSNPPYVLHSEKDTLHSRVRDFEPGLALFVDDTDPIFFYRKVAALAQKVLKSGGKIYFECHADHALSVQQMLVSCGFQNVCVYADMAGLARIAEAEYG